MHRTSKITAIPDSHSEITFLFKFRIRSTLLELRSYGVKEL